MVGKFMAEDDEEEEEEKWGRKLSDPQRVLDWGGEAEAARLQLGSTWAAGVDWCGRERGGESEQRRLVRWCVGESGGVGAENKICILIGQVR